MYKHRERSRLRLQLGLQYLAVSIFGYSTVTSLTETRFIASLSDGPIEPIDLASFPSNALSASQAVRARLKDMYRLRRDEGDGDILTFHGPRLPEVNKEMAIPKRRHRKRKKLSPESQVGLGEDGAGVSNS